MIQPGKLVQTTRAQIGVPRGTIGLVIETCGFQPDAKAREVAIYTVQLIGVVGALGQPSTRRYLGRDLREATNESR